MSGGIRTCCRCTMFALRSMVLVVASSLISVAYADDGNKNASTHVAEASEAFHAANSLKPPDLQAIADQQRRWDEQRAHLLDLIFPHSSSWTRVQDLPVAFHEPSGEADFSRFMRAMAPSGRPGEASRYLEFFRKFDLGSSSGIIYVGDAVDAEGFQTFVWPHFSAGGPLPEMQVLPWQINVIRVKQADDPKFTGIEEGCCGGPFEAFFQGDLLNPQGTEIVLSSRFLEYPEGTIEVRFPIYKVTGFTIRLSPEIDDKPSLDTEDPIPAIGNVARKICCNVENGTVLSAFIDKVGKHWLLMTLKSTDHLPSTDDNDLSSTYDYARPPVDIGWVDAGSLKIAALPKNQPLLKWLQSH